MGIRFTEHDDLLIHAELVEDLITAARNAHPREACGLLLGRNGQITAVRETRNVHPAPATHFEIDPQALIDAHRAEREGGLQVMGYFHSHPDGKPFPSETDRAASAGDGKIWAIVAAEDLTFWQNNVEGFCPLSYEVIGR